MVELDYFASIVGAARTTAVGLGYSLMFAPRLPPIGTREIPKNFDGYLIVDPIPGDAMVHEAHERGIPLVTTGRSVDLPAGNWVDVDVRSGALEMLEHLDLNGARSVSLLTGPHPTSFGEDVKWVYEEWCRSKGITPDLIIARNDLSEQAAFDAAIRRFKSGDRPQAILCTFERLAVGALIAASAVDMKVPDDILIAACADAATLQSSIPPITVLDLQPAEVARQAVTLLVDLIE